MIDIKNIYGKIIFTSEALILKDAVIEAVSKGADLSGADLRGADLRGADLRRSNLYEADLSGANLRGANLSGADLSGANLSGANLSRANLGIPSNILQVNWGICSDMLTIDLMRYDAANHPEPDKFIEWSFGGSCPYSDLKISRSANFTENRHLIDGDFLSRPVLSAYQLMLRLIAEHCKNSYQ